MIYHFIGIKGSGMSSLAQIMKELGYEVQGSDKTNYFFTEDGLRKLNIKILPFDEKNIKDGMIIIRGASFHDENEEVRRAKELNLEMYSYSQMVGKLTEKFKTICVAGCHGKTTTTSMLSFILNKTKGCNYLIGDGTGFASKENELFTLEACEYRRHFLDYSPNYVIITNIDLDHVDYFNGIDDVIDAYTEFSNKASKMIIACGDDPYTRKMNIDKKIVFYGTSDNNDIIAKNVKYSKNGISFDVSIENNFYGHFEFPFYGEHMLLNSLAVISICYYEGISVKDIQNYLVKFKGANRRFTESFVLDNVIIDDYAHHPNEIRATLNAVEQKYSDKKIITIFQPHTFSRTNEIKDELVEIFNKVEKAYILDVHPAREKQEDYPNVTSDMIIKRINNAEKIAQDQAYKLKDYRNSVLVFMSPNDLSRLENDTIKLMESSNLERVS